MGDHQEACDSWIHLRLGIGDSEPRKKRQNKSKPVGDLSISLPTNEVEEAAIEAKLKSNGSNYSCYGEEGDEYKRRKYEFRSNLETKKLKLTNEQYSLLETSFEFHDTLDIDQKKALSKRLGIKPRQIAVWFQNRRARTKQKQTEIDFELLKRRRNCLLDENRRLKIELQYLRSL